MNAFKIKKIVCFPQVVVLEGIASTGYITVGMTLYANQKPVEVKGIVLGLPFNTDTVSLVFPVSDAPLFFFGQVITTELNNTMLEL